MDTARTVVTEAQVRDAHSRGVTSISLAPNAVVTPLARDTARSLGIRLRSALPSPPGDVRSGSGATGTAEKGTIAIGSDHGGYQYKSTLIPFITELGWTVRDVGTNSEESCDYPDFAYAVARLVVEGGADLGIMIDGAGIGSSIVCNKIPGIRAACAYNEFTAWNARAHNDANVLTLGSRTMGIEVCKRVTETFIQGAFEGGRHQGRVDKIAAVETRFSR